MGDHLLLKMEDPWDFPGGPVVKTVLPSQGAWVGSLFRELQSCMPAYHGQKNPKNHFVIFNMGKKGILGVVFLHLF